MARAWLSDDVPGWTTGGFGIGVSLDDDEAGNPLTWTATAPDGTVPVQPVTVLPTVTVRSRLESEVDVDGNRTWDWADLVVDVPTLWFETREERDDAAGLVRVTATAAFAYPADGAPVYETAAVRTSDGYVWRVTKAVRAPGRYTLTMERLEEV